ncbi:hypothetical protein CAEBREN_15168 [Caenorhabditis brenneri]|uniref:Serpentine receptor class gamma n=1 Tax=Caenorhabditis brenneri TaxID=135651 RepID=G0NBS3_CAEBE|nr:hypothetical protein CAEBREN_15168 [Caenorhabditis brenneri]
MVFWISLCFILAISTSVSAIWSSQVQRQYIQDIGFVAVGVRGGLHMLINRLYYLLPFCSIICYFIMFHHFKRVGQQSSNLAVSSQNSGPRKIFVQMITASCYGAMAIFVEFVYFFGLYEWSYEHQLIFINLVTISNYLPEMSFPFLLLLQLIRIPNRIHMMLGSEIRNQNIT